MKRMHVIEPHERYTQPSTTFVPDAVHAVPFCARSLSVLVVGYREEQRAQRNVQNIVHMLQTIDADFEVIIVKSDKKQREKLKIEPFVPLYPTKASSSNFEISLNAALQAVQKDVVCILDASVQFSIVELSKLFPPLEQHDIVLGYAKSQGSRKLLAGGGIWNRLVRFIFGIKLHNISSVCQLYHAECLHNLSLETHGLMMYTEMLYKCIREGFTYTEVCIAHNARRPDTPIVMARALWELFIYAQKWYVEELKSSLR